ncbi:MAG: 16S rRNA (cytidine(1402)-2'-O)-methyltransferase [Alphaproteobacteria bacterium]|nr:16S rRNA (cytidine(1402)-2'-O)-methyltransferase [Alphaproteobacteria bacterium]MCZ6741513.1 16S rRNA (cytidine(1402)-2'-O)-methyltransferase [Alphaproteobacteria bacterium]
MDGNDGENRALEPGLYLVATPIGNLRDITLRALDALAAADVIACEDSRVTAKLLAAHAIATPMTPYHEHNAARARPRLIRRLKDGGRVALVSDAGTPLISDPGFKLVAACREFGIPVTVLPGASAPLAALVLSGLPSDRFLFAGFLPAKPKARRDRLAALAEVDATLVLFESGRRLAAMLADAAEALGSRPAVVCRELTKLYEEVVPGDLKTLAGRYGNEGPPKGEMVIVIGPPAGGRERVSDAALDRQLRAALAGDSLRDAVAAVAQATGLPRRRVYARALRLCAEAR